MVIYITHQKASGLARKFNVPVPKKGEEFLIGKCGAKLGKKFDQLMGRDFYVKIYGYNQAAERAEFNI